MWGIYTVDSDTRRSPSFRDSLSYGGSLENVRMLGVNARAGSRSSSPREPHDKARLFDDATNNKFDPGSRPSNYADGEPRKQLKLDTNGVQEDRDSGRHCSRASTMSTNASRHDSERRLIRNANQGQQPHRHRRGPEAANHEPDPEAEAAAIREKRRRKIVFVIILVAASLLLMSILLMVITIQLTPAINEKVRQQHEADIARQQLQQNTNHSHIVTNSTGADFTSTINSTFVEQ